MTKVLHRRKRLPWSSATRPRPVAPGGERVFRHDPS
jgi:hypothetical protein